jgi:hypothetical protein
MAKFILHDLGTLHHQALGQVVNNNVKQISRTFDLLNPKVSSVSTLKNPQNCEYEIL